MYIPNITINIIVSVSENWVIGKNNKLLWRLNSDLKRFKELTTGHPVIMGQKTFESLPNGALPNRTNIVLTEDINFSAPNVIIAYNIDDALNIAEGYCGDSDDVFIIGGGMIYKQFLDIADFVYLTTVHTIIDGDTTFPKLDDNWKLISEEFRSKDDKNDYDHTYKKYQHFKYLYDNEEIYQNMLEKELTTTEKEERQNLETCPICNGSGEYYTGGSFGGSTILQNCPCGQLKQNNVFTDWNKLSLDDLSDYLENKYRFNSSGEALAILKMVDFYRKHKNKK